MKGNKQLLDCGHRPDKGHPATIVENGKSRVIQGWTFVLRDDGRKICHACDMKRVLDCGHHPSPHEYFSSGTAHTADGREICYDCATKGDLATLEHANRFVGYLSDDGKTITNWPGRQLMTVTRRSSRKLPRPGFTFDHRDYWTIWARDPHGNEWIGQGSPGIYIQLRRIRNQATGKAA